LLSKFGKSIGASEAKKAQAQGISLSKIQSYAKNNDVKVKPSAKKVYNPVTGKVETKVETPVDQFDGGTDFGYAEDVVLGEDELSIPELNAITSGLDGAIETNKAQIYADAQRYESTQATERTRIETKGRLDLQPIINAGLKDVAEIEGRYGLQAEQTRQAGARDIARIGTRSNILQGLVGAFNF